MRRSIALLVGVAGAVFALDQWTKHWAARTLADRAPSAWLASHTSHCAVAVVGSSVEKAAVQARSRIPVSRKEASSSTTRRSPSR